MQYRVKVLSIKISHKKKSERVNISTGKLRVGYGLEGDAYSKPGEREVCIMSKATSDKLKAHSDGLCVKRFIETLSIDLHPDVINVGDVLAMGDAEVKITKKGKRCFPDCALIKKNKRCPLVTEPMFAQVIKSGTIKV